MHCLVLNCTRLCQEGAIVKWFSDYLTISELRNFSFYVGISVNYRKTYDINHRSNLTNFFIHSLYPILQIFESNMIKRSKATLHHRTADFKAIAIKDRCPSLIYDYYAFQIIRSIGREGGAHPILPLMRQNRKSGTQRQI